MSGGSCVRRLWRPTVVVISSKRGERLRKDRELSCAALEWMALAASWFRSVPNNEIGRTIDRYCRRICCRNEYFVVTLNPISIESHAIHGSWRVSTTNSIGGACCFRRPNQIPLAHAVCEANKPDARIDFDIISRETFGACHGDRLTTPGGLRAGLVVLLRRAPAEVLFGVVGPGRRTSPFWNAASRWWNVVNPNTAGASSPLEGTIRAHPGRAGRPLV